MRDGNQAKLCGKAKASFSLNEGWPECGMETVLVILAMIFLLPV